MGLRNVLHHTTNITSAFAGAVGTAVFVPLMLLSAVGFPNGSSQIRGDEVVKYGAGSAVSIAFFAAGYRRSFFKVNKPQTNTAETKTLGL